MDERLQCDIVLRGGITSGIVYPLAIAKLAETYDFRSIGGSSAGAIVAAWTAATALAAKRGHDKFQTRIKSHPQDLASKRDGKTVNERLFQPQPSTRRLFNVFMALLGGGSGLGKWTRVGVTLCAGYPLLAFAGAALSLLPFFALVVGRETVGYAYLAFILTIASATVLALLAALIGLVCDVFVRLPKNGYGLCSGSNNGIPDSSGVLPLTDWLHEFIQSLAEYPLDEPVTFGDLWRNGGNENAEREIELVMMTTNITRGVSHRLPFLEGNWGQLFFHEEELAQLFPACVVKWMTRHAQEAHPKEFELPKGYHRLPKPADLPILFGARMSASLPFLLSAVPLYAAHITHDDKFSLKCCWFSDGGLASDLPLHFFDVPIPSRPTFAINFVPDTVEAVEVDEIDGKRHCVSFLGISRELTKEQAKGWDKVWMPTKNNTSADRFNSCTGVGSFLKAVLDTALNWADTELMAMPGYRDRIVHVKLASDEGGFNLNMPSQVIMRVSNRGKCAGELLAARFAPNPGKDPQTREDIELTWDNHRWVRYRSVMTALEVVARRFRATWISESQPWRSYRELLTRNKDEKPNSYALERPGQYAFAVSATDQFVNFVSGWTTKDQTFDRGLSASTGAAPRPKPILRVMPPGSNDPRG
jgi:predicted acylesterase/phospholipase RssA